MLDIQSELIFVSGMVHLPQKWNLYTNNSPFTSYIMHLCLKDKNIKIHFILLDLGFLFNFFWCMFGADLDYFCIYVPPDGSCMWSLVISNSWHPQAGKWSVITVCRNFSVASTVFCGHPSGSRGSWNNPMFHDHTWVMSWGQKLCCPWWLQLCR